MLQGFSALSAFGGPTNSLSLVRFIDRTRGTTTLSDDRRYTWLPISAWSKVGSSIILLVCKYRFTLLSNRMRVLLLYGVGVERTYEIANMSPSKQPNAGRYQSRRTAQSASLTLIADPALGAYESSDER